LATEAVFPYQEAKTRHWQRVEFYQYRGREGDKDMTDIRDIVKEIDTLKPIPPIAVQILVLVEDVNSCMAEIAETAEIWARIDSLLNPA
jgi:hypothetical protein